MDNVSGAQFYNEVSRIQLGSSQLGFSQTSGLDDCIFSVALPSPEPTDFTDITVGEESTGDPVTVSIAIYYPATFVQQTVDCQTLPLNESNTEKVRCVSTFDVALTPDVSREP